MKSLKLFIPELQNPEIQTRIFNIIRSINGIVVIDLQEDIVVLDIENERLQSEVIDTLQNSGYKIKIIDPAGNHLFKFKTNINCGGCIEKIKPVLNTAKGINHWNVDTTSKDKTLTVESGDVTESQIKEMVQNAGFKIELI